MCCWSVGLVQREIEAAGIATITLSTVADLTVAVGAPRVAAIEHPPGRAFGQPDDAQGHRAVLRATLGALEGLQSPGIVHLPFEWGEPRNRVRWRPRTPTPIESLLKRRPWLYWALLTGSIPE